MHIAKEQLSAIMPSCKNPTDWAESLNYAMDRFGIAKDRDYVAAFLAQVAHESGELSRLEENLNYSAERLMAVWPKRFPTLEIAQKYDHDGTALANFVYANRLGNGDAASGDGWKFRGRGLIMVTGRTNYAKMARLLDLPLVDCPDSLQTSSIAALSAAAFWQLSKLNILAEDLPDDDDNADFVSISRIVNGGAVGLKERQKYWLRAKKVFGL